MKLLIKICGMRDSENILAVSHLRPDMLGFIFYRGSPRFAGEILDPAILANIPPQIMKTGVFVNPDLNTVEESIKKYSLEAVQLHGDETPELCRRIKENGTIVIKVFNVTNGSDFAKCAAYISSTDYFLFDTMSGLKGGSGQKFNWQILGEYNAGHPFLLSGGIDHLDADKIGDISNPYFYGIDLNSRFEIKPGFKDIEKLRNFINVLRD